MKRKFSFSLTNLLAIVFFALLITLYFLTEYGTRKSSVSTSMFRIFGQTLPFFSLAGVLSSISTIILILFVIFYRKVGFYTSILILTFRILRLIRGLSHLHESSLPAIFITLAALIAVLVIYHQNEKIHRFQEQHQKELIEFTNSIIDAFSVCIDGKDSYTNGHSLRVAKYTRMLALKLGESNETAQKFYNIALLHDIGKIGIPDEILNKPGKLTKDEYEMMKNHAYRGYEILKNVKTQKDISDGAKYHHERFDGKGYPANLSGQKIPYVARLISVADAFDAMSSTRPYRKKLPMNDIIEEIKRCSGSQFDPDIANAFLSLYEEGAFDDIKTE